MSVRALQRQRALHLYRHSLKNLLDWTVYRPQWWEEAQQLRAAFERNAGATSPITIDRLLDNGEQTLKEYTHPDPYIPPYYPGGSLFQRNPPMPPVKQHMDFGREGYH